MQASKQSLIETAIDLIHNSKDNLLLLVEHNHAGESLINDLNFFLADDKISRIFFPDYETLAYEFSPVNTNVIAARNRALFQINCHKRWIMITTPSSLFQPVPDQTTLLNHCLELAVGQEINTEQLKQYLSKCYTLVDEVKDIGQYSARGNLYDIYPNGSKLPCRIELDDDVIFSIRFFDPIQQRSLKPCGYISIIPCQEIILTNESKKTFIHRWSERCFPNKHPHRQMVVKHNNTNSLQAHLPLFYDNHYLIDLVDISNIQFIAGLRPKHAYDKLLSEYELQFQKQAYEPLVKPTEILIDYKKYQQITAQFKTQLACWNIPHTPPPLLSTLPDKKDPATLQHWLDSVIAQKDSHVLLSYSLYTQLKHFIESSNILLLDNYKSWLKHKQPLAYTKYDFCEPIWLKSQNLIILTPKCVHYQATPLKPKRAQKNGDNSVSHSIEYLDSIEVGQLLVHQSFGIGKFLGLVPIKTSNNITSEYLLLEYQNNDKVYVPVYNLDEIRLYSSHDTSTKNLSNLNSKVWKKTLKKAEKLTQDYAAQILQAHAQRAQYKTHASPIKQASYEQFCNEFPFNETPDQLRASREIANDLASDKPMDRLLCADVSFGKTEVAMRACYQVIMNNHQVIILVPTTILAHQHYENFCRRFDSHNIEVSNINGTTTSIAKKKIIERFNQQHINILIGTHTLFSNNFPDAKIGLVVVDEEHRFGVKQKEKIKQFKIGCHSLMMSATPIPRTLNFAMSYLHDLSLMTSPPEIRVPIITKVCSHNLQVIDQAINREIKRGGQVYYLHNDINTIIQKSTELQKNHPKLKIGIAHAQLNKKDLEKNMQNFYHQHIDLLICTTIIESGIDISNANTIIIERADKLGLAQLHQLRGRVGRSHQQGYAYLFKPKTGEITPDAKRRLSAIEQCKDLGSSFQLAIQDLEIRGAGNILGTEQSGSINQVGYYMYTDLLKKACQSLEHEPSPAVESCICQLSINAYIEDSYISDINHRLNFYKRLSNTESLLQIDEIHEEIQDRYGNTSESVKQLIWLTKLKWLASRSGIYKISGCQNKITLSLSQSHQLDANKIIKKLMSKDSYAQPSPDNSIRFDFKMLKQPIIDKLKYIMAFIQSVSIKNN